MQKFKAAEKTVKEALKKLGYTDIEIIKDDVLSEEAGKLGIMISPTVAIEKVVKFGGIPSKEEVKRAIEGMRKRWIRPPLQLFTPSLVSHSSNEIQAQKLKFI